MVTLLLVSMVALAGQPDPQFQLFDPGYEQWRKVLNPGDPGAPADDDVRQLVLLTLKQDGSRDDLSKLNQETRQSRTGINGAPVWQAGGIRLCVRNWPDGVVREMRGERLAADRWRRHGMTVRWDPQGNWLTTEYWKEGQLVRRKDAPGYSPSFWKEEK